nr:MFS transporter [Pseudobutyrivibrio sp.]
TFDAVLPALVIPKAGNNTLGIVTACSGIAMVIGSFLPTILPKPKNRVRVIYLTMLFSLGIENFILAFSSSSIVWCVGQFIGWFFVPLMAANQDVIMRSNIPVELQGRVYACRNTLQFFTIPIGLFLGGFSVDNICEPFMAYHRYNSFWSALFGTGKGSGAALMMFVLGISGTLLCLVSGQSMKKYRFIEQ